MSALKTLLFATDFSEGSIKAAAVARNLAQLAKARLYVVNVVALLRDSYSWNSVLLSASVNTEELDNDILKDAQKQLDLFIEQNFKTAEGEFSVEAKVLSSAVVYESIISEGQALGADIIILGTHGRSGLNRALVGSVAEHVVRASPIPVLTVRG